MHFRVMLHFKKREVKMNKQSRLTIDMPSNMHIFFKMLTAELGVSMKQYFIEAALKSAEEIEDQYLAKKAQMILKDIKEGKEKTISWKEMRKRVKWDDL